MLYQSTRGKAKELEFAEVLLTGLAQDGGLYVPHFYPKFSATEIAEMQNLEYQDLAYKIISPYIGTSLDLNDFKNMLSKAYKGFKHEAIAPLKQISANHFLLELFHGPTLAFKDIALQLFGHLLDHLLKARNEKAIIVGATSGDTGSAAIYGCMNCENVKIFIIHPKGKTSDIQRKQMTTINRDNVFNLALDGNFDDGQEIVKTLFKEKDFLPEKTHLIAVNSINWARISAQIVYYFYAALRLGAPYKKLSFSVPTGNFGDIFAGYLAKQMGLPIEKLIIATNENDILTRFIKNNSYKREEIRSTLSPSMDIQVSSNFERLLFDYHQKDGKKMSDIMDSFYQEKSMSVDEKILKDICQVFSSERCDDIETVKIMQDIHQKTGEIIDPHTATAIKASNIYLKENNDACVVSLATAHPAKFPKALEQAGLELDKMPEQLDGIFAKEEKYDTIKKSSDLVKQYILNNI